MGEPDEGAGFGAIGRAVELMREQELTPEERVEAGNKFIKVWLGPLIAAGTAVYAGFRHPEWSFWQTVMHEIRVGWDQSDVGIIWHAIVSIFN
jgi:hypothetical protein